MCHSKYSSTASTVLGQDPLHFHTGEILTVANRALVLLLALKFENNNLVAAAVRSNSRPHASILQRVTQDHLIGIVRNRQNTVKLYGGANIACDGVYLYCLPR